ncbi:MAG TPA: tetratricopeptide repeat protein [Xanthobacteraceae bacterium]
MPGVRFLQCALLGLGLALSLFASPAGADELKRLYAQVLRDPTNSELNFRYARLAEERGEWRKALSAYERILVNDPDNPEVRRALQRIRRKLQPNTTQILTELGGRWESNPRRVSTGTQSDGLVLGRVTVRDERAFGDASRWRTIAQLLGDIYFDNGDLNYGYVGAYTGPLVDLTPTLAMHAGLGGGTSYFDHRLFFSEAIANLTFETYLEGAYQTVNVRGGYRSFDDFFPSDNGFFVDVLGKFAYPNIVSQSDIFVVSSWFRWSNVGGTGFSIFTPTEQVQPGRFIEYGGKLEYYHRILEWLTVGANISVSQRDYARTFDVGLGTSVNRRDVLVAPGATVVFHQVWGHQTDLRVDYRFERNNSNLAARDYDNHIATLMIVARH